MGDDARSIQIEEDLSFQTHQLRFERIGWAVLALLLVAALLGFFGGGPLSSATAGADGDPIRVRFERLARTAKPTTLTVDLASAAAAGGEARVWIDRRWASTVRIESVAPEPESVEVGADRLVFVFAVQPADDPVEITFHVEHEGWGWQEGVIGLDGGPSHEIRQLVFP